VAEPIARRRFGPPRAPEVFVWRALYGLLETQFVVTITSWILRSLARLSGRPLEEGMLGLLERRLVLSGWPHQSAGWVNLHLSRFVWRVRRQSVRRRQARKATHERCHVPLRIGLTGCFSGLLGFPRDLFEACPSTVALHIFDIEYRGRLASYLRDIATGYFSIEAPEGRPDRAQIAALASTINASELDVLVSINWREYGYEIIDAVTTPCIVNHTTGSDLMHHEKIDVQLYLQPQADYLLRGSRLFCCTTERLSSFGHVRQIRGLYDRRGMEISTVEPWKGREPLIVFHGSLRYLEGCEYLATIFALLHDDKAVQFVFMGKDNGRALGTVMDAATRAGVASQVHYEGVFSAMRSEDGTIVDDGWLQMLAYLQRARLKPDPWPFGGGSSRFEGYLAGTPSVHFGLRVDRASWRRRQQSVCDVPLLQVPVATARSTDEYSDLCRRCLYDEEFADGLISEQLRVAATASDPAGWWDELLEVYEEWYRGSCRS
jgi:hypothetical protein